MRILFFIDSLMCGGKERRLTELMKGLRQVPGIDFEIVVMDENIHYKEVFDLNITIHYLIRKTKKDLKGFTDFYKICKKYKPDIVHCWDSMTAIYSAPVCRRLGIKLVNSMVVDTPIKKNIFNKNIFRARLTFPFSKIIIGNSEAGLAAYKSPRHKSICIYNGFNFKRSDKLTNPDEIKKQIGISNEPVIGMVAAFEERKDYTTFINTAKAIIDAVGNHIFLLLGDGDFKTPMLELVTAPYQKQIKFLGKIDNVEPYINVFDVAVLCTNTKVHQEGISNSILEYMALGKPVLATAGGGTNEIVEDNKTGFLIKAFDISGLKEKIELLLANRSLRTEMGQAGKERIENVFSIDKMISSYVAVYNKILS